MYNIMDNFSHSTIRTVLIDDIRDLRADIILRNGHSAVYFFRLLSKEHELDLVMFDHDLSSDLDGNQVMRHMFAAGHRPRVIELVTANPVGRDNMIGTIADTGDYARESLTRYVLKERGK